VKPFPFIASLATLCCGVTLHAQSFQQEKECSAAAERQLTHDGFSHGDASIASHYNAKLGRCYAEFARTKFEDGNLVVFREVVDVVKENIVAQITWIHAITDGTGATSTLCIVDMPSGERVICHEIHEFDGLVEEQYGIK
jgi:hypothetical protein